MYNISYETYERRSQEIGERIRTERKKLDLTQDGLAEKIDIGSRQTIAQWENGVALPPLSKLLCMCDLFGCETGYLLCDYDCKTRTATDIQKETGLSEAAINELITAHTSRQYFALLAVNALLEDSNMQTLDTLGRYFHIDDKFTVESMSGQPIKEKTLIAIEIQPLIDSVRQRVQKLKNEGGAENGQY